MRTEATKALAHIRTQDLATDWSMRGKTVLFTGASRGMGRLAAIELARRGAEILVVGHHDTRGAAAVGAIRATGSRAEFLRAEIPRRVPAHHVARGAPARQRAGARDRSVVGRAPPGEAV